MGTARNFFTGDYLRTKPPNDKFREAYDKIDWSHVRDKSKDKAIEPSKPLDQDTEEAQT